MEIFYTLWIVSILIWIVPPVRQFKNRYFYFFLVLSLSGIISYFLRKVFFSTSNFPFLLSAFLQIVALQNTSFRKRYNRYQLPIMFLFLVAVVIINNRMFELYMITFLHVIILFYIISHFFYHNIRSKELNLFFIVLVLYQTLSVFKFINVVVLVYDSAFFFIVTFSFQILIGLFFCFVRPDNPKFSFKLTSKS